jgi:hypothetical protein
LLCEPAHSLQDNAQQSSNLHSRFFRYVFISRNTWILGSLKHIETTLIVLPKRIIEAIKGRGQDLDDNLRDVHRQVADNRSWFSSPREFLSQLKLNNLLLSILFFPLVILVIVMNLVIIALLIVGLGEGNIISIVNGCIILSSAPQSLPSPLPS